MVDERGRTKGPKLFCRERTDGPTRRAIGLKNMVAA